MVTSCFCDFGAKDENPRGSFCATFVLKLTRKKEENQKSKPFLSYKLIYIEYIEKIELMNNKTKPFDSYARCCRHQDNRMTNASDGNNFAYQNVYKDLKIKYNSVCLNKKKNHICFILRRKIRYV